MKNLGRKKLTNNIYIYLNTVISLGFFVSNHLSFHSISFLYPREFRKMFVKFRSMHWVLKDFEKKILYFFFTVSGLMGNLGNMQQLMQNMPPGAIEDAMKNLTPEKINEALESPQMQKMMQSMGKLPLYFKCNLDYLFKSMVFHSLCNLDYLFISMSFRSLCNLTGHISLKMTLALQPGTCVVTGSRQ